MGTPSPHSLGETSPTIREHDFFSRLLQHPPHHLSAGVATLIGAILCIGFADYYTGPKVVMILFYLMPIAFGAAWFGRNAGCAFALSCSLTHAVADFFGPHEHYTIVTLFNRLFVLGVFLLVACCIAELLSLQRQLGQRVLARTNDLERALAAQVELQNRVGAASRYERSAIGRELHDGLGQHLAATNIAAGMLADKLNDTNAVASSEARQISTMLTDAIAQTRKIARGLLLASVKPAELDAELTELCRVATRKYRTECSYKRVGVMPSINDAQSSHMFFIAQEALRNALKYARASHVDIVLSNEPDGVILSVTDDGAGFSPTAENIAQTPSTTSTSAEVEEKTSARTGLGLSIMRHRAELIGGRLVIESETETMPPRHSGTRVYCYLPNPFSTTASLLFSAMS